jgi:hypothetical protein
MKREMTYRVYTGSVASNYSVNISCHGSFEAKNNEDALRKINFNTKHRYCKKWKIPSIQDPKTYQWVKPDYIECLHANLKYCPFVCEGEPFIRNVVWKHPGATICFFQKDS